MLSHHHGEASNTYNSVAVSTSVDAASPHALIGMLLRGALERIAAARVAMMNADMAIAGAKISSAVAIVMELQICLDLKQGGSLAAQLDGLYDYIVRRLLEANRSRDQALLLECINLLSDVYSAWLEIPPGK